LQVRDALEAMESINEAESCVTLRSAAVTEVVPLGLGDRVCVDLCDNLAPGEGLLVGNFCRGLFLVHSEVCWFEIFERGVRSIASVSPLTESSVLFCTNRCTHQCIVVPLGSEVGNYESHYVSYPTNCAITPSN
jgi:hypothetical protein